MPSDTNKPKVLIVYPPNAGARPGIRGIYYPLGIGYIAAVLKNDHDVVYHDFNYDHCLNKDSEQSYIEMVLNRYKYDYLLIGGVFPKLSFIKELISISRRISKAQIIVGGSYLKPSINILSRYLEADYYVIGEGEKIIQELLGKLNNNAPADQVDGIGYFHGDKFKLNSPAQPITDLDHLPFPARELSEFNRYKRYFALGYPLFYTAYVISSRGCPLNCVFCNPTFGRKVRVRTPENILEEITHLRKQYGCKFIYFHDEVLLGGQKEHITKFCEYVLSKSKHRFYWGGTTNARMLDNKTLDLMKKAGCLKISLGVESGSKTILAEMRKTNNLEHIKVVAAYCSKIGIELDFSLLTNTFSENEDTLNETRTYLKSFNNYYFRQPASINFITPIPGTDLYDMAKKRGLIDNDDLSNLISLNDSSRYKLKFNLTNLESDLLLKLVNEINQDISDDYYDKHPLQKLLNKTNLMHFKQKETFCSLMNSNPRSVLEGLLWTLCKGNENTLLGRTYKRLVYEN